MRKVMIAGALKRNDSRPEAESSSASTVPARTTTAPRRASLKRQRLRTRRMTSTSSVRWSMSPYSLCRAKSLWRIHVQRRNRGTRREKCSRVFCVFCEFRVQRRYFFTSSKAGRYGNLVRLKPDTTGTDEQITPAAPFGGSKRAARRDFLLVTKNALFATDGSK